MREKPLKGFSAAFFGQYEDFKRKKTEKVSFYRRIRVRRDEIRGMEKMYSFTKEIFEKKF